MFRTRWSVSSESVLHDVTPREGTMRETTDFRAPLGAPSRASSSEDFAPLRVESQHIITVELEIADEPI